MVLQKLRSTALLKLQQQSDLEIVAKTELLSNYDAKSKAYSADEFTFKVFAKCQSQTRFAPQEVIHADTPWNCKHVTSPYERECVLQDQYLINMLVVFIFVIIAKEGVVLANYWLVANSLVTPA
jgi:hypothetical protein